MYYDERENAFNYSDIDKESVSVITNITMLI